MAGTRTNTLDGVGSIRITICKMSGKKGHEVGNITRSITVKDATVSAVAKEIEFLFRGGSAVSQEAVASE